MNTNTTNLRSSDLSHDELERLIRRGNQLRNEAIITGLMSLFQYLKHGGTLLSGNTRHAKNRGQVRKAAIYG